MHNLFGRGDQRPVLLIATVKLSLAVIAAGYLTAIFVSSQHLDENDLGRIVAAIADMREPVTTGSILQSARNARIDPCTAPPKP
jgi:hypothetical protein